MDKKTMDQDRFEMMLKMTDIQDQRIKEAMELIDDLNKSIDQKIAELKSLEANAARSVQALQAVTKSQLFLDAVALVKNNKELA